jgi:hypothetical protein
MSSTDKPLEVGFRWPGHWASNRSGFSNLEVGEDRLLLSGRDNYGKPCQEWADKLAELDDSAFVEFAAEAVYWSAWASSNPHSDYHWQADACYMESKRRGDTSWYQAAYDRARRKAGLDA